MTKNQYFILIPENIYEVLSLNIDFINEFSCVSDTDRLKTKDKKTLEGFLVLPVFPVISISIVSSFMLIQQNLLDDATGLPF